MSRAISRRAEVLAHESKIEVVNACEQVGTVVEGYIAGDIKELFLLIGGGNDGAAESPDVVMLLGNACEDVTRGLVGTSVSARHPDDDEVDPFKEDGFDDGIVDGFDVMAQSDEALENAVDLLLWHALRRKNGRSIMFLDTDDDIPSSQVVYVVGKGANGMHDWVGVEACLELNTA